MAIIAGNVINTGVNTHRAEQVILAMEALLAARYRQQISRKVFFIKWASLRKRLLITPEYQDLIRRVRARANGKCESCHRRFGEHVHHKDPVAFAPRKALVDSNCVWVCPQCHEDEDKLAREVALKRRRHYLCKAGTSHPPESYEVDGTRPVKPVKFETQAGWGGAAQNPRWALTNPDAPSHRQSPSHPAPNPPPARTRSSSR